MNDYVFRVKGDPQPKGSTRSFVVNGRPITTSANPRAKDWEKVIRFCLQEFPVGLIDGPVLVDLDFFLARPGSAPQKVTQPAKRPDLDKLIRAALDAMTGIVFKDDGQVTAILAVKKFATETDPPGLFGHIQWEES